MTREAAAASDVDLDVDLIRRIAGRDRSAAAQLFDRHAAGVLRFIARRVGAQECDDVLQEVFVRALRRASTFRGESSVRTWLYAIARLVVFERHRSVARRRDESLGDLPADRPGPESFMLRSEEGQRLLAALQRLPDEQALVLELYHVDGLTHDQVGEILGISAVASRKRLQRAARWLGEALAGELGDARHRRLESWRDSLLRRTGVCQGKR